MSNKLIVIDYPEIVVFYRNSFNMQYILQAQIWCFSDNYLLPALTAAKRKQKYFSVLILCIKWKTYVAFAVIPVLI